MTRPQAYAVQDRVATLIGGQIVGWKMGATVRPVQLMDGHDGALPGRIFADRCFESPARIPANLFQGVKVECEFAFRLTQDLPVRTELVTPDEIAGIMSFAPAFELAGSRYAPGTGGRAPSTFDGIADNGSGVAAVLGPAVPDWRGLPFETMEIEASIDGVLPIQMFTGAYRRSPLVIAAETFSDLHARGVDLPAGTCVLTGSLSLPTPMRRGQTIIARFAGVSTITLTLT
ncbi:MAG: 2-keto-4-pentenoate hydratase [Janthinobacterium lividum]